MCLVRCSCYGKCPLIENTKMIGNFCLKFGPCQQNLLRNILIQSSVKSEVSLHKKWSFALRISLVNVTKSSVSLRIWLHYLKKSIMESFIFCAVYLRCDQISIFEWCSIVKKEIYFYLFIYLFFYFFLYSINYFSFIFSGKV